MKKEIAKALLGIKAVFLSPAKPFTWASGILSPIYCDNRLVLSYPQVRRQVEAALAELLRTHYPGCELVAGTATAGIPHAALVAELLNLPMAYVRAKAKDHGRGNQIEGKIDRGQRVVVIEDLISTAGSAVDAVQALRDAGARVLGIASIFTYGMEKGEKRLMDADVRNISLTDFHTLAEVAAQEGYIKPDDIRKLEAFWKNPADDSWTRL
ncbi:MAG: orotate phosphoribosyltransferase [Firmicutes bacterium]|nr:orotate phosphoribosyltransferase [Bacillota bacterium]